MLTEYMIQTENAINKMNASEKKALYLKIKAWFDCDERLVIISTKTLNDYLWAHDPIIIEGGVVDFGIANNLISKKG